MKKELLSPAGNMECLIVAVQAGADAVYVGGKKFGARKFASNFTIEELSDAVKYCHLYGVRLYVTVNTIIYEEEMEDCLDYVLSLHQIGVDALIVQDIGLIKNIRERFPNMELHASTQCHNYNQEQFMLMEELGLTRVVLAREMSLDDIEKINTSLEKEVFIHGAICISYSGQCLFSSLVMNRSGNRGECAGMCRLPYSIEDSEGHQVETEGKYLLSPKELCTIPEFKKLMESDITSFKIEGRMKSSEYVYLVTKIYRLLMDKYERGEELTVDEEDYKNLQILFNREFTLGHLFRKAGNDLMNIKTPNHVGIPLGKVVRITEQFISILLTEDIYQEDGIRFSGLDKGMMVNFLYDEQEKLIHSSRAGTIIKVDNKIHLEKPCDVLKTSSNHLMKELAHYEERKVPIDVRVTAKLNCPFKVEMSDGINNLSETGNIVDSSIKQPTTKEVIEEKISRVGDTPFTISNLEIVMDENIFIPMKEINEIRRKLTDQLIFVRENEKKECVIKEKDVSSILKNASQVHLSYLVRTEEQLLAVLPLKTGDIYTNDKELYLKYRDQSSLYYQVPRVSKVDSTLEKEHLLITDFSQVKSYSNSTLISDYYLNVVNHKHIEYLFEKGVSKVILSVENNLTSIKNIINSFDVIPNIEVMIYGRVELMIMHHCMLNHLINKGSFPCHVCDNSYYLKDRNGEKYPIISENKSSKIFDYRTTLYSESDVLKLKEMGVKNFKIEFFQEESKTVKEIIKKYKKLLQID